MAEGITRRRAHSGGGLADYYRGDRTRIVKLLTDADRDSDLVSLTVLSEGPVGDCMKADGAIVILKGGSVVEFFREWAIRNRIMTADKPIVDPKTDA